MNGTAVGSVPSHSTCLVRGCAPMLRLLPRPVVRAKSQQFRAHEAIKADSSSRRQLASGHSASAPICDYPAAFPPYSTLVSSHTYPIAPHLTAVDHRRQSCTFGAPTQEPALARLPHWPRQPPAPKRTRISRGRAQRSSEAARRPSNLTVVTATQLHC